MIHIIFHNDFDGQFAAYAAWKYFQNQNTLDSVKFIPVSYGDKFPLDMEELHPEDHVYVFSFLYERELMDELKEKVRHLLFFNHMESAEEKFAGASYAIINTAISSGARVWDHFFPIKRLPLVGQYIGDRKMWKKRHPETPQMHSWLNFAQLGQDWEKWDDLATDMESVQIALKNGRLLLRYEERMVESFINLPNNVLVQHGHLVKDHSDQSTKYAIFNGGTFFTSEIAQAVMKKFDVDYTIDWRVDMGNDIVTFNIRSRDGEKFSAKEYAEKNGGGGRAESAGFTMHVVDGLQLVKALGL